MDITTTVEPSVEPVGLDDLKAQMRFEETEPAEDDLINALIKTARRRAESFLHHRLITQTVALKMTGFQRLIEIPVWPVQSISSIAYTATDGSSTVLDSSKYQLVESRRPRIIAPAYGEAWPATRSDWDSVTVTLVVGYGSARSDVPEDIVHAIKLMAADMFEHREETVVGASVNTISYTAKALLSPYRLYS